MKDPKVLTSAALFRELYDSNKDIYDVISEFIRTTVLLHSTWSFTASDCASSLYDDFGFQIPEVIVKTCLRNRLVKSGEFSLANGVFSATDQLDRTKSIQEEFDSTKGEYDEILNKLVIHVKKISVISINEEKLKSAFNDYLLYENVSKEYSECISHFLIKNESDESFKRKLNRIVEGLVLYTGIQYSGDLSTLGHWSGHLTIFLDTEHLFSAVGFNGILHKRVFDDFYSLIKEVNGNKKGGKILLRYFSETEDDVNHFFHAAEKIFEDKRQVDPSKPAMVSIINGSKSRSEIVLKKTRFFSNLKQFKISVEEDNDYYKSPKYNVESQSVIDSLQGSFNHKSETGKYSDILKKFTKINCLRKGVSNVTFENVSAIFMTENGITRAVSFSDCVRSNGGIPFATNIEFMTERLWFKLNKGFSSNSGVPASFDVVTKAKLVLSSQLNNAVSDTFRSLVVQHQEGKLTDEDAATLIAELKGRPSKPEDFTPDDIDDSKNFISSKFIEDTLREKSILERRSKEGEDAVKKLKAYEHDRKIEINKPYKAVVRRQYRMAQLLLFVFIPLLIISKLVDFYTSNDTFLSIVFGLCSLIGFLMLIKVKVVNRILWRLSTSYYRKYLTREAK